MFIFIKILLSSDTINEVMCLNSCPLKYLILRHFVLDEILPKKTQALATPSSTRSFGETNKVYTVRFSSPLRSFTYTLPKLDFV